jgi:putative ABC transport system permease protein
MVRANDNGPTNFGYSMILPIRPAGGRYLLRTEPSRRDEVLKAAVAALERSKRSRIILDQDTITDIASEYYRQDKAMVWLLASVCAALLVVTALGIVGLASFWVQQRTKQIGVRRALGATRTQVLRYFQTENFLLTTIGIVLGMLGAFGLNQLLMTHYELPRLPVPYLPIGALVLWLLGQIAVFGPARRAAAVPPAIATRSV